MRTAVMFTLYATSSKEQTGDVIMLTQFEEGNILTKTRNDAESGDKSDNKSIMMIKQDMDAMNYGDESDHVLVSTEILDRSQNHTNINRREANYKIRDHIRERQSEWKGELKATQKMGNGLHKLLSTVVKDIFQELTPLGEYGSEVYHFTPRS